VPAATLFGVPLYIAEAFGFRKVLDATFMIGFLVTGPDVAEGNRGGLRGTGQIGAEHGGDPVADAAASQLLTGRRRVLALNACIWHNCQIGAPVKRSLIAYDHA
jgi:hypothetical protein